MPNYAPNTLHELQQPKPKSPRHEPHKQEHPNYGVTTQRS